jgi:hypothetical protein
MKNRPIDELRDLLGFKSTYEMKKNFKIATSTWSNVNAGRSSQVVRFLLRLSIACLRALPKKKKEKIVQNMKKT